MKSDKILQLYFWWWHSTSKAFELFGEVSFLHFNTSVQFYLLLYCMRNSHILPFVDLTYIISLLLVTSSWIHEFLLIPEVCFALEFNWSVRADAEDFVCWKLKLVTGARCGSKAQGMPAPSLSWSHWWIHKCKTFFSLKNKTHLLSRQNIPFYRIRPAWKMCLLRKILVGEGVWVS